MEEALPKLEVEGFVFPPVARPPGSSKVLFLGGAGRRGLEIGGKFITFTAIAVYLEEGALQSLAGKWKGKSADDLAGSVDFFRDIFSGPFEKFTKVTMVLQLTGQQYAEKVTENCVAYLKAIGVYTEAEGAAVEKFRQVFKAETFSHGQSILFTHSPSGSLTMDQCLKPGWRPSRTKLSWRQSWSPSLVSTACLLRPNRVWHSACPSF